MMEYRYKIVSLDLDGTLLNDDMHVSAENKAALCALKKKGIVVVPNSGRTLGELPAEVRDDPDMRYVIHSDGAVIYDKETGTRHTVCMSRELSDRVLELLQKYRVSLSVRYNGRSFVRADEHNEEAYISYRLGPTFRRFLYETATPVTNFDDFVSGMEEIEMICAFFAREEELTACRAALLATGEEQVASSAPGNIEVFSVAAGKGNALLRLAAQLGIDGAATIAVGDSTNDSDMIKKAGLGLAMENAYAELKELADDVACRNTEHIVKYLQEKYFS